MCHLPPPDTSSLVDARDCSSGWKERTTNKPASFTETLKKYIKHVTLTAKVPAAPGGSRTASLGSSLQCQTAALLQPFPNPPQASRLPSPLSSEIQRKGENKPPLLTSRGGGKRRLGGLSPCRRPPSPPPCPCPLCQCGKMREAAGGCGRLREAAGSCGRLREAAGSAVLASAALAGARGSCRADFQQRGSAPALPAEQTPHSRTHFFPQGGPGSCSASTIPCLQLCGAFPLRDTRGSRTEPAGSSAPAPAAARSAVRHRLHFPTCGQKPSFFTKTLLPHSFHFYFIYSPCNCLWKVKTNWR